MQSLPTEAESEQLVCCLARYVQVSLPQPIMQNARRTAEPYQAVKGLRSSVKGLFSIGPKGREENPPHQAVKGLPSSMKGLFSTS